MAERLEHHAVPLGEVEQLIELLREGIGIQFDVIHLSIDSWTPEHERLMVRIQKDLGYFSAPLRQSVRTDEYPAADNGPSSYWHGALAPRRWAALRGL